MVKRTIVAKDRVNKQLAGVGGLVGCQMSDEMATEADVSKFLPGCLMVIGGAEDRASDCRLLQAFAELCGGNSARIALITTASGRPAQSFAMYQAAFRRIGTGDVRELWLDSHEQANSEETLATLAQSTGIFFTGGDQARLQFLAKSRAISTLRRLVADGSLAVAGTSAGATALGPVMILGGNVRGGSDDRDGDDRDDRDDQDAVEDPLRMGPGLGLLPASVVDVHFTQRTRLPRLVAAVTRHPSHLGIGVDEDTAVLVQAGRFDVLGRGGVVTVEATAADPPAAESAESAESAEFAGAGERVPGMRLHRLRTGDAFDLERRHPIT